MILLLLQYTWILLSVIQLGTTCSWLRIQHLNNSMCSLFRVNTFYICFEHVVLLPYLWKFPNRSNFGFLLALGLNSGPHAYWAGAVTTWATPSSLQGKFKFILHSPTQVSWMKYVFRKYMINVISKYIFYKKSLILEKIIWLTL
jgi:hypothetical protein